MIEAQALMGQRSRPLMCAGAGLLICAAFASPGRAALLIDENFQSFQNTTPVDIANNGAAGVFTAKTNATGQVQVVNLNGNRVLQLTDTSTSGATPRAFATFAGIPSSASGENRLNASIDICFPTSQTGSSVIIGIGKSDTTSGADTAIQFAIAIGTNINLTYKDGSTDVTAYQLAAGTWYRLLIKADFSSDTQDTWSFQLVTANDPSTILYTSASRAPSLNTRVVNLIPTTLTVIGGDNASFNSASPLVQIDNVLLSTVPEPAALGLMMPVLLLLGHRKK